MTTMISLRGVLTGLTLTLAALLAPASHAAGVAGISFDEQIRLADAPLLLNGAGVRSKFMFKVYALGLYLPRKTAPTRCRPSPSPGRSVCASSRCVMSAPRCSWKD
jgi:hypothetical protein